MALCALPAAAAAPSTCTVELRPAARLTSVGEDFDQVKRLGQDLRDYNQAAGKPLDWLSPARQLELIQQLPVTALLGLPGARVVADPAPISRIEALAVPTANPADCTVRIMIPQAILERGGLAKRSLRIFGVVRRYEGGSRTGSFAAFGEGPMTGFRLARPEDAPAATALVEQAYKQAVEAFLKNTAKSLGR